MHGILIGHDLEVAEWAFRTYGVHRMPVNRAFGVLDDHVLVGAALFQAWNGSNVEVSFYGEGSVTLGVVRSAARVALFDFGASRVTLTTPETNARVRRFALTAGFSFEGTMRHFYGPTDGGEHTGARYVIFREGLMKLAKVDTKRLN